MDRHVGGVGVRGVRGVGGRVGVGHFKRGGAEHEPELRNAVPWLAFALCLCLCGACVPDVRPCSLDQTEQTDPVPDK